MFASPLLLFSVPLCPFFPSGEVEVELEVEMPRPLLFREVEAEVSGRTSVSVSFPPPFTLLSPSPPPLRSRGRNESSCFIQFNVHFLVPPSSDGEVAVELGIELFPRSLLFRSATSVGGGPRNDHILLQVRADADSSVLWR